MTWLLRMNGDGTFFCFFFFSAMPIYYSLLPFLIFFISCFSFDSFCVSCAACACSSFSSSSWGCWSKGGRLPSKSCCCCCRWMPIETNSMPDQRPKDSWKWEVSSWEPRSLPPRIGCRMSFAVAIPQSTAMTTPSLAKDKRRSNERTSWPKWPPVLKDVVSRQTFFLFIVVVLWLKEPNQWAVWLELEEAIQFKQLAGLFDLWERGNYPECFWGNVTKFASTRITCTVLVGLTFTRYEDDEKK